MNTRIITMIFASAALLAGCTSALASRRAEPRTVVISTASPSPLLRTYLDRVEDALTLEFDRIVSEGKTYPPSGEHVKVTFAIDRSGKIARIVSIEGTKNVLARDEAMASLTNGAPFGVLTDEMGSELTVTASFRYE